MLAATILAKYSLNITLNYTGKLTSKAIGIGKRKSV